MTTKFSRDLSLESKALSTLSAEECGAVAGGMKKLPFQRVSPNNLLTTPDGEPVNVYVDGLLINNVTDGFVHI